MSGSPTSKEANIILYADDYLLFLRWAAVGAAILFSFFATEHGAMRLPLPIALAASGSSNLLLSVYTMQQRPFATGRPRLILIADAAQGGLGTFLVGGYYSVFFPLFILLVAEIAVALSLRSAVAWILSAVSLHVAAVILNQVGEWTALGASLTVGRLIALLIIGALALVFSEYIRREERSRWAAEDHATQLTTLNDLFFQLNQPSASLEQTLSVLLAGAHRLLHADVGAVLVCDTSPACWTWIAGNRVIPAPASEFNLANWGWQVEREESHRAGPAYHRPLPPVWANQDLQAVTGIRLCAPAGHAPGALIVGRGDGTLSEAEWLLFRALAREAELAVRNAQLYASEHAQLLRLQEFEQTRQSFLSAIAHELRTPLTVLKTLLPTMNDWDQVSSGHRQEILTMAEQNLGRLELLISDFLESTRLEAGAVVLHRQPLDLAPRVRRALDSLRPLFLSKQQQIICGVQIPLPCVNAERRRVDQILSSLLHNAHKFTPAGGTIRVVARANDHAVQTCVEDDGPGVPVEARDHIFDKFYSAPAESALAGLGLGLFICHELVSLHGGGLWYEERTEGGSRFCFTLPLAEEESDGEGDQEDPGH